MAELIRKSMLSGILVGVGTVINTLAPDKTVGALLFSFALLTIIHLQLPLYTGRIGFVGQTKASRLAVMLGCNFVGAMLPPVLVAAVRNDFYELFSAAAEGKFGKGYVSMFVLGVLCGVMMFVAVYTKKDIIVVFCIMIFILSGFEHCVADFPYFVYALSVENVGKLLCVVAGNSIGSIGIYYLVREKVLGQKDL